MAAAARARLVEEDEPLQPRGLSRPRLQLREELADDEPELETRPVNRPIKRDLVERHQQDRQDRRRTGKASYPPTTRQRLVEPTADLTSYDPSRFREEEIAPRKPTHGGRYFSNNPLSFIPTGCKLFDLALGGGWVEGRCSNVVGDKSTGKTLVAIEAMANYAQAHPDPALYLIRYQEVEDAFDDGYAQTLGMPVARVQRPKVKLDTVQEFERDLEKFIGSVPQGGGGLYILDSLDALSDADEVEGPKIDKKTGQEKGSYGLGKAKAMSRMFRRLVRKCGKANVHLMIISQLRDKIGVMFGEKHIRAGGRALDLYDTHVVWLANLGKIKKKKGPVERSVGIQVKINVKKNKVAQPFREVEYPILFAYGIDDLQAALDWLEDVDRLGGIGLTSKTVRQFLKDFHALSPQDARVERRRINKHLKEVWYQIESEFLPPQGKYQ
jgi:recombination protein RecA